MSLLNDLHVVSMHMMIPGSMGMNTPFNVQLDGKNAAINGDFRLRPSELNPVIKVLRANGIEVASIHNHLLDNDPQLVFIHFWAYGDRVGKGAKSCVRPDRIISSRSDPRTTIVIVRQLLATASHSLLSMVMFL